jgi:hypothetical protein
VRFPPLKMNCIIPVGIVRAGFYPIEQVFSGFRGCPLFYSVFPRRFSLAHISAILGTIRLFGRRGCSKFLATRQTLLDKRGVLASPGTILTSPLPQKRRACFELFITSNAVCINFF